jgi:hypothetical protein
MTEGIPSTGTPAVRVLGGMAAEIGGRPLDLGGPRQRAVLGLLAGPAELAPAETARTVPATNAVAVGAAVAARALSRNMSGAPSGSRGCPRTVLQQGSCERLEDVLTIPRRPLLKSLASALARTSAGPNS